MSTFRFGSQRAGFTLVEMLIVVAIISVLVSLGTYSYIGAQRSAHDGKRKGDMENVRAALEQYRAQNDYYPRDSGANKVYFNTDCSANSGVTDGTNTYMSALPSDAFCQVYSYIYTPKNSNGACDNNPLGQGYCTDYTLGAYLEQGGPSSSCTAKCNAAGTLNCNYCVGPYGTQ